MIGKEILNYRIVSLLGQGGMGSVYMAQHKHIAEQKVAIKCINANMANSFTRELLRSEAQSLSMLHHTNVVTFLDYHIDDDNNLYLVMEYAEGRNLEDYIQNVSGLIVQERICPLFEPILDGFAEAHRHNIVHRDIKPANIVVTNDGTPKILDFGIATVLKSSQEENGRQTMIMGTPSYMSPEQVRGEAVDKRSDIYSLGVLLFHMLTGHAPFDTTTMTESEICREVVEKPLPRMRTYYKHISDAVQAVVDKATDKNPDKRFQSCEEFKRALHKAVYPKRVSKWVWTAAAVLLMALAGGGYYWIDYNSVKTSYYKNYVERWGVPEGIDELSGSEHARKEECYEFKHCRGRLLSMRQVNSLGNTVVPDDVMKPVHWSFTYSDAGDLSRVKAMDNAGKLLWIKSYNEKLNTAIYQYDDEYGSEYVLENSYATLLKGDDSGSHSQLSRELLAYDENGFVKRITYADRYNTPTSTADGAYGLAFERDDKGRVLKQTYLGRDGNPRPLRWGLCQIVSTYDDWGNETKKQFLTIDGKPSKDADFGVPCINNTFNQVGNRTSYWFTDLEGNRIVSLTRHFSHCRLSYNDKGQNEMEEYFDLDGKPTMSTSNYAASCVGVYDGLGYLASIEFRDADGKPSCMYERKYSKLVFRRDSCGNPIEEWLYHHDSLVAGNELFAGVRQTRDSVGRIIRNEVFGTDRKPILDNNGVAGYTCEYNDRNEIVKSTQLGLDGKPAKSKDGICITTYQYGRNGNLEHERYYEPDGTTPAVCSGGNVGADITYDDYGNRTSLQFIAADGRLVGVKPNNVARYEYKYNDENHWLDSICHYGADRQPMEVNGVAVTKYKWDQYGNMTEEYPVGKGGHLTKGMYIIRHEYDSITGNLIATSAFNESGPAFLQDAVHREEYQYNPRGLCTRQSLFGVDGCPVARPDYKWATAIYGYDDSGNLTTEAYLGVDGRACVNNNGCARFKREYNASGLKTKEYAFGAYGQPTDPKQWPPVVEYLYDGRGNVIVESYKDRNGNNIRHFRSKCSIVRMEYNDKDLLVSVSGYDEQDRPIVYEQGYHKEKREYDALNRQVAESYYDVDDTPMLRRFTGIPDVGLDLHFGVWTWTKTYGVGVHRCELEYDGNSEGVSYIRLFDLEGRLLAIWAWNGNKNEFVPQYESNGWQQKFMQLARQYPMDMGYTSAGQFSITGMVKRGDNECEISFAVSKPIASIPTNAIQQLKDMVELHTKAAKKQLDYEPVVFGTLYDGNGELIYQVRY